MFIKNCTGCRMCEMACSLYLYGKCQPDEATIRVTQGPEGFETEILPERKLNCLKCRSQEIPDCVKYCSKVKAELLSYVQPYVNGEED